MPFRFFCFRSCFHFGLGDLVDFVLFRNQAGGFGLVFADDFLEFLLALYGVGVVGYGDFGFGEPSDFCACFRCCSGCDADCAEDEVKLFFLGHGCHFGVGLAVCGVEGFEVVFAGDDVGDWCGGVVFAFFCFYVDFVQVGLESDCCFGEFVLLYVVFEAFGAGWVCDDLAVGGFLQFFYEALVEVVVVFVGEEDGVYLGVVFGFDVDWVD